MSCPDKNVGLALGSPTSLEDPEDEKSESGNLSLGDSEPKVCGHCPTLERTDKDRRCLLVLRVSAVTYDSFLRAGR